MNFTTTCGICLQVAASSPCMSCVQEQQKKNKKKIRYYATLHYEKPIKCSPFDAVEIGQKIVNMHRDEFIVFYPLIPRYSIDDNIEVRGYIEFEVEK